MWFKKESVVGGWMQVMNVYQNKWKCVGWKMSFCSLLYKSDRWISQEKHKSQLYTMRKDTYEEYVIKEGSRMIGCWMYVDWLQQWVIQDKRGYLNEDQVTNPMHEARMNVLRVISNGICNQSSSSQSLCSDQSKCTWNSIQLAYNVAWCLFIKHQKTF